MLEEKLEQDIKTALLAGDSVRTTVLRGIKASLLNEKVALGKRDTGLSDAEVLPIFAKEAKKRQESADLYIQGGDQARADKEIAEKLIIETYLPAQLSEAQTAELVDEAIAATGATSMQDMGKVIAMVREKAGAGADGGVIAKLTKEKLAL
jgi:uncharacterized protein YqeY